MPCRLWPLAVCLILGLLQSSVQSQTRVLTQRYDNGRTGTNTHETTLNSANVDITHFGKLYSFPVDGPLYAQPLYFGHLLLPGKGTYDVVFACTFHNTVYALNADGRVPSTKAVLWERTLDPVNGYQQGIRGTPVIDSMTNTLYVITATIQQQSSWAYRLHALDITTGSEKFGGPVTIQGSVPGTGPDNINGIINFNPQVQQQRPGLLLLNSIIYMGFGTGSEPASDPTHVWHGWIFAYHAGTLQQCGIFCTTPNGTCANNTDPDCGTDGSSAGGGVWNSARGLAGDADGNVYFESGNGYFDAATGGVDYGNAFIKMRLFSNGLHVVDWFAPSNVAALNAGDEDLGSTSALLVPGTDLLVGGGKAGGIYVLDQSHLGGFDPSGDTQIIQEWPTDRVFAGPAYWNGFLYTWNNQDPLSAYQMVNGKFNPTPTATNRVSNIDLHNSLSISASGATAGSGIVWGIANSQSMLQTNPSYVPTLHAFNASNITQELWNSQENASVDAVSSPIAQWVPPMVADGKVFLASDVSYTGGGVVQVYGQHSPSLLSLRKPASASSSALHTAPSLAVDGSLHTGWASRTAPNGPEWITVDLGNLFQINRIFLGWNKQNYATVYQLQVSTDNSHWTPVFVETAGMGGLVDVPGLSISGRYVRVYGTHYAGSGYGVQELQVYGITAAPVRLTSPTDGDQFPVQRDIILGAYTSLTTVTKIDFYANTTLIGTATKPPYLLTWNAVSAGQYRLTAAVTQKNGQIQTSPPIEVTVQ